MSNTLIRAQRQGITHRCVLPAYRLSFDCIFSAVAGNVWCYEQVCLAGTFNLALNLMANLLIARVSSRFFIHKLIRNMKKYQIIYADPAWQVMAGSKQSRKDGDSQKSLPLTYPTMSLEEIKALNVKEIKAKDSVLFLWTINKYLEQSYAVARAWGFEPSTMLVWDKTPKGIGLGGTFTLANEYLLFCRSGTVKAKQRVKGNHWHLPREKHSRKPDFFRNLITETFGELDRIELFARERHEGWDTWGNEVVSDVVI